MERHDQMSLLGMALSVLARTERAKFSIAAVDAFVGPPVKVGQILVGLCAYRSVPRAFLTYAYLSDDVLAEFQSGSNRVLHYSEWNEGTHFYLADIVAPSGNAAGFLRFASAQLEIPLSKIHYRSRRGTPTLKCLRVAPHP